MDVVHQLLASSGDDALASPAILCYLPAFPAVNQRTFTARKLLLLRLDIDCRGSAAAGELFRPINTWHSFNAVQRRPYTV